MQTDTEQTPPCKPPAVVIGFAGDEAEELGEQIMALTLKEAVEVSRYLQDIYGLPSSP